MSTRRTFLTGSAGAVAEALATAPSWAARPPLSRAPRKLPACAVYGFFALIRTTWARKRVGMARSSPKHQFTSRLTCCTRPLSRRIRSTGNLDSSAPAAKSCSPGFPQSQLLHDSRFWSRPSTAFDQLFDRRNHHEQEVRFRCLCALDQAELLRAP